MFQVVQPNETKRSCVLYLANAKIKQTVITK